MNYIVCFLERIWVPPINPYFPGNGFEEKLVIGYLDDLIMID